MNAADTIYELILDTHKQDANGCEICYVMGLRHHDTQFCAWVLETRLVDDNWLDHGYAMQSKVFDNKDAADEWVYNTATDMAAAA